MGCVLKISHILSNLCSPCREGGSSEDKETGRKTESRKERSVTSQTELCDLILRGSALRAGASGGQRGEEEGRRPLQAQSRTAIAVQKDTGTHPSCRIETFQGLYIFTVLPTFVDVFMNCSLTFFNFFFNCIDLIFVASVQFV